MLVCLYARCSTRAQSDAESIPTQLERGRAWIEREGMTLLGEPYIDAAKSGGSMTGRPAIHDCLAACCRHRAVLLVSSISRLGRCTRDVLEACDQLHRAGTAFIAINDGVRSDSPSGKLLVTVLSACSSWELDVCRERTTQTLAAMRRAGRRVSFHPPWGWSFDAANNLIEVAAEQAVLNEMQGMRTSGMSYQRIADSINSQGISSKLGNAWTARGVRMIFVRLSKLHAAA
ncbi:MAG: recombinase family protein [Planctomycetes bacterium]|nr:recombinase family protein [Planctomycetota bacterium]